VTAMTASVTRRVEHVMGLPISLALRGRHADGPAADTAWAAVLASLRDADQVFSTYRADSVVSRVNRGELALGDAPAEVHEVLTVAERTRRATDGAFSVWRDGTLDPSGVVKGWAVQRASAALRELSDTDVCLAAGGDLVAWSAGDPWRIGIEDPRDPTRLIATVPVTDGAVASSGTAHRGAHLVDARTGTAPVGVAGVTVLAASLTDADVDATAAYALGTDALTWLRRRVGRTGLVVWTDGTAEPFSAALGRSTA
jgi:FAD:protein FMN transferase